MHIDARVLLFAGLTILLWGCLCAAPVWWLLMRRPEAFSLSPSWNVFSLASGAVLALGLLCYYVALEASQASILVPLTSIYPAVSVVLSYALLHERLSIAQWLGVVMVIVGAILLLSGPTPNIPQE